MTHIKTEPVLTLLLSLLYTLAIVGACIYSATTPLTNLSQQPDPMTSPTIVLPDGSAFFTSTIMSKDEAMALPVKERPLNHRLSSDLYHAVFEAIGGASMCWNPLPGKQIFDSTKAEKIAVELCFKIANEIESKAQVA